MIESGEMSITLRQFADRTKSVEQEISTLVKEWRVIPLEIILDELSNTNIEEWKRTTRPAEDINDKPPERFECDKFKPLKISVIKYIADRYGKERSRYELRVKLEFAKIDTCTENAENEKVKSIYERATGCL